MFRLNPSILALLVGGVLLAQENHLRVSEYRLGPEDVIHISVWDHDDLARTVPISRKGDFRFPLIGTVVAAGLTTEELEKLLTERLADGYIIKPSVSVEIKTYRARKITVVGPVENSGEIPITKNIMLIDLLAMVNVDQEKADDIVRIFHPSHTGGEQVNQGIPLEVNWKKLVEGHVKYNLELTDGDVVVFRHKSDRRVFVLGEVKNPGPVPLKPEMRLMDAIAAAGGPSDAEAEELLLTQRPINFPGEQGHGVTRLSFPDVCAGRIGMDIILEDGNTIFIPESDKKLVFVHGEVKRPGAFDWIPRMTVEKAVATAGGLSDYGTWKGIRLLREQGTKRWSERVTSGSEVLPGDIIYVPEGWF